MSARHRTLAALLLVGAAAPAFAQGGRADGAYPSTVFCEAASGLPATRERITVTVEGGRATYAYRAGGVTESGSGTVVVGRLTLEGRGRGAAGAYEARYAGELGGRGGLLTGAQVTARGGGAGRRACQMTVGIGRD